MSARRRAASLVAATALVGLCAACGDDTEASPPESEAPTDTAPSGSHAPGDDGGGEAPPVSNPLDPAALASDPCSALTSDQLDQLGLEPNDAGTQGDTCQWKTTDGDMNLVNLNVFAENDSGLNDIYGFQDRNEYFEPTEITGYPGVYTAVLDSRDSGACDLWVGVNDQQVLHIAAQLASTASATASCDVSADVAEAAITTLGG